MQKNAVSGRRNKQKQKQKSNNHSKKNNICKKKIYLSVSRVDLCRPLRRWARGERRRLLLFVGRRGTASFTLEHVASPRHCYNPSSLLLLCCLCCVLSTGSLKVCYKFLHLLKSRPFREVVRTNLVENGIYHIKFMFAKMLFLFCCAHSTLMLLLRLLLLFLLL